MAGPRAWKTDGVCFAVHTLHNNKVICMYVYNIGIVNYEGIISVKTKTKYDINKTGERNCNRIFSFSLSVYICLCVYVSNVRDVPLQNGTSVS